MTVESKANLPQSDVTDSRWRDFVARCLVLDLEVVDERIREVGAVWGAKELRTEVSSSRDAVRRLHEFGNGAEFVVGHNIVAHDRRFIEKYLPGSALLRKPVVDTLYLAPLAKPQQPYHSLVKDYKLIGAEPNDPLADCRLTLKLLEDCWMILQEREEERRMLLSVYRSCFVNSKGLEGTSTVKNGTGLLLEQLGGQRLADERVRNGFVYFTLEQDRPEADRTVRACPHAVRRHLPSLLASPETRPAVAYALAWLTVAGTESVLPRWVHKRFPQASRFLKRIRGVPCGLPACRYCPEHHNPRRKLKQYFGFPGFRETPKTPDGESLQERIVEKGIAGESILAILPTGGGKSLGFQLPAVVHNEQTGALTVVISPLQALMKDQVDNLNSRTETPTLAATLNGLQTMIERRDVLEGIRLGKYALLYVAPEQLRSKSFESAIRQREIAAWVFDEAHCISKWGHDFRPDYLYAARFIKEFSEREGVDIPPIGCFTATAKLDVREEIRSHFRRILGKDLTELSADRIDRENLYFSVEEIPNSQKIRRIDELLREALGSPPNGSGCGSAIVYARSRHRTKHLAEMLHSQGWNAEYFHGGLDPPEKKRVQDAFISGELPVIVATNAFGMGIDKDNVRLVVHADIPGSIENYLQEAGRAGRDGKPADCVLLFTKGDLERQFDLVSRGRLTKRDIAQILRAIRKARRRPEVKEIVVSPGDLLRTPDIDLSFHEEDRYASTRVKTAISWLERARFVLRNENRTRLYQGVAAVPDLKESQDKIKELPLTPAKRRRWLEVLTRLHHADLREGIEVDEIAHLSSFRLLFDLLKRSHGREPERLNRIFTQQIFRTLHEMTSAGLLTSGIYLSAWIRHKTVDRSTERLENIAEAQKKFLKLLRSQRPDACPGDEIELSIPQMQEKLRAEDLKIVGNSLLTLLRGWMRKGVSRQAPVTLQSHGRRRLGMTLEVSWNDLAEQLELRNEMGRVVLKALGEKADEQGLVGERLVLFSLDDLQRAVEEHLGLGSRIEDFFNALEKTLLFLDENHVIRLEKGLSVFRQAMTIQVLEEAKGRRYSEAHYGSLREHYEQKMVQIHAIGRYAEESQKSLEGWARGYVNNYFRMSRQEFNRRYFPGELKSLKRPTSKENYTRIVESLRNRKQERIVIASKDRNLLVLAGPGSGKTRVVVHRAAYLLMVARIRPERLLVICFNRSAMHELRVRLRELVGDLARRVAVHTYHSLALRVTERSMAERVRAVGEDRINDKVFVEMIEEANRRLGGKEQILGAKPDELRERLLSGFEYVLVDEYQDIDEHQYEMITHIARRPGRDDDQDQYATILAVGDDDQNIYTFRGANVEFLRRFEEDFGAEHHYLVENYRSTQHIIHASNALIRNNRDRMKVEHPIRINAARARDPAGGEWERLDPLTGGRVSRIQVDSADVPATTLAEIERLRRLSDNPDWQQYAILAWSHAQLAPVRALLEKKGVPVRRSVPDGLPRLDRIREFRLLLDHLAASQSTEVSVPELRQHLNGICHLEENGTCWTGMADRMLAELETVSGTQLVPETDVTEVLLQGLADHNRSHLIGHGVLVSTIHAAKGLEFDHVLVLGGLRKVGKNGRRSIEEERRLYYVAMTRARRTLALIDSRDNPNRYFAEVGSQVHNRTMGVADLKHGQIQDLTYEVLGMADLWLDFAGRQPRNHSIHRTLSNLQSGEPVTLKRDDRERVWVLNRRKAQVARLSAKAARQWSSSRIRQVDETRILGVVHRTKDDTVDPKYRDRLRVDSWEVPILEVRTRQEKRAQP